MDLVHWTEAFHRSSSRDTIIVVGSVLEKHFDGDLPEIKKKKPFSIVGHRGTRAENFPGHSTG